MEIKTTKKEIQKSFKNIICVEYGDLQNLLSYTDATFYTCGLYGWNADAYKINNNTIIVTGYRPFGNIENYEVIKKYENKAKKIKENIFNYEEKKQKLNKLLNDFIKEILKNE